jgi:pimeloyl-ACP methyl ester carboxylesterase
MLPHHFLPEPIKSGRDSIAFHARNPKGRLIVFVHGFGGSATGTWNQMHEMLPLRPESDGWDIVFYGYPSLRAQALNSANLLRQFISNFTEARFRKRNKTPAALTVQVATKYNQIIIVAHSLGALITRQAVLDAYREKLPWLSATRLILFGPAHRGASLAALGKELLSIGGAWGALAAIVFKLGAPVLKDLEPVSTFVKELQAATEAALKKHKKSPLKADRVIFGEHDFVVEALTFCQDRPAEAIQGQGHMSVCKPLVGYLTPLEKVVEFL